MDHCVVLPIVESCLDATAEETTSACKNAEKYAILTLIFEKFSGGIAPRPHTGEGLWRPSPDPTPLGAPALRASAPRSGPSVPPSTAPPIFH